MRFSFSPITSSRSAIARLWSLIVSFSLLMNRSSPLSFSYMALIWSFCSSISLRSASNRFFISPFSPRYPSIAFRSSCSLASYRAFISSTSWSMSSSSCSCHTSNRRRSSTSSSFIAMRTPCASASCASYCRVTSITSRLWSSISDRCAWSCCSCIASRSCTSFWYRSTSCMIFFWYRASIFCSSCWCRSSACLIFSSNSISMSFFSSRSSSNRLLFCSSSCVNFSVISFICSSCWYSIRCRS
mmetsp:Transcript_3161/g.9790  ORF Transcript_3161/g.9790 Transcript_3161/m.9790 type:complete len:243 (-) Transcript_3161:434-1162(-)